MQGAQENEGTPEFEVRKVAPLAEKLQAAQQNRRIISWEDWEEEGESRDVVRRQRHTFFEVPLQVENACLAGRTSNLSLQDSGSQNYKPTGLRTNTTTRVHGPRESSPSKAKAQAPHSTKA